MPDNIIGSATQAQGSVTSYSYAHGILPELAELNKGNNPNLQVLPSGFHVVNLKMLLSVADQHNFGVVAINQRSPQIIRATLEAAWKMKSPVILEVAESEVGYCNMTPSRLSRLAHEVIQELIERYGYAVPVGLHHDHIQKDITGCVQQSIEAGFSSVLVDLSKLSLDENIAGCQGIARLIYPMGIALEVEEGVVHSVESSASDHIYAEVEKYYTKVEDMEKMIKETMATGASCFIGNQHGVYKDENPRIGYGRLFEIAEVIRKYQSYPVMHGGSGLKPDQFNRIIEAGARKINYATSVSDIWFKHLPEELLGRMNQKVVETGKPLRKVLPYFEEEVQSLDHRVAILEMTEHIAMMMDKAFSSAGMVKHYQESMEFLGDV